MSILDTLPMRFRKYRTHSVSDEMLRDPLRAWQAVSAPAARTAQINYVRQSRLVTCHENFFDVRDTVLRKAQQRAALAGFGIKRYR
jgi:hypothetical protein